MADVDVFTREIIFYYDGGGFSIFGFGVRFLSEVEVVCALGLSLHAEIIRYVGQKILQGILIYSTLVAGGESGKL